MCPTPNPPLDIWELAKMVLSAACQPEVKPSSFSCALKLTNCISKFVFSHKDNEHACPQQVNLLGPVV